MPRACSPQVTTVYSAVFAICGPRHATGRAPRHEGRTRCRMQPRAKKSPLLPRRKRTLQLVPNKVVTQKNLTLSHTHTFSPGRSLARSLSHLRARTLLVALSKSDLPRQTFDESPEFFWLLLLVPRQLTTIFTSLLLDVSALELEIISPS